MRYLHSRQNAHLQGLRQRLRGLWKDEETIAVEGPHLIQEAVRSGLAIEALFVREDQTSRTALPPAQEVFIVSRDAFDHACATQTPQGVAALVQRPPALSLQLPERTNTLLLILEGIQDPGNLGTILRSAEAFGADGVALLPGTVRPWNQKALRASSGSAFRVPILPVDSPSALVQQLRKNGITLYAAVSHEGTDAAQTPLSGPVALLIGNEGAGISQELLSQADGRVRIPCVGPVESLNAAVAASILLYAAAQQRTAGGAGTSTPLQPPGQTRGAHARKGPGK